MRKILFGCLLLAAAGCRSQKAEIKEPLPQVVLAPVKMEKVSYYIRAVGNAEPYQTVKIIPQISGEVIGYFFKDGAEVAKGDLLYKIDPSLYLANLEESAGLLEQARADHTYQNQKVDRYTGLLPEEYVSDLDYQQYAAQLDSAKGKVVQYKGAVMKAEVELDYATIKAPFSGRCGMHQFDPGSVVRANQEKPLVTINQISPIYLLFSVPEKYLNEIRRCQSLSKKGLKIEMIPLDGKKLQEAAYLDFINNTIDQNTGTVQLRGISENTSRALWPGQYLSFVLELYDLGESVLVPEEAVGEDAKGFFAWVAKEDNTAQLRRLVLGQQHGGYFVVDKGLEKGERVIVEGLDAMKQGKKFEVKQ